MENTKNEVEGLLRRFDQTADVEALNRALTLVDSTDLAPTADKAETLAFRTEKLRRLLAIFDHLDAKLIPGFDFQDLPPINAAPPPETGLPAGVAPASIRDPNTRAQYEKAIAANQARAKIFGFQSRLREAEQACTDAVERHVSTQFPKSSQAAVEQLIDDTIRSQARRASLKEHVATVFLDLR